MNAESIEGMALLNVLDVAHTLNVSTRQVWKLCAMGKLVQPLRLNRSVRWRRTDIETFVAAGCDMAAYEAARRAGGRS